MTTATENTGLKSYYPEMGEPKPESQIEAALSHYGKHWFLKTPLTLKGRGIKHLATYTAITINNPAKIGWHRYQVTEAAFDKLCREYAVSTESLL